MAEAKPPFIFPEVVNFFLSGPGFFLNRLSLRHLSPKSPRNLRLWVLFAVLVAVMQFSDPLGGVALADAVLFWSGRVLGAGASLVAAEWFVRRYCANRWNAPAWLKPAVLSMVIAAVPMTLVEVSLETAVPQTAAYDDSALRAWSPLVAALSEYLTILSVVLPLNVLLWAIIDHRSEPLSQALEHGAREPAFLKKTNGIALADVIALAAEEHYVRVMTADRSELVYGRLSDAIAEMPESAGMQVHRSWWVAEGGHLTSQRGERRYRLQLSKKNNH